MNCKVFSSISGVLEFCNERGDNNIVSVTHLNKNIEYPWVVFYRDKNFQ